MSRPARAGVEEAPRDQTESAFTPILRRLWTCHEGILAVTFVDHDGECVDYVSGLDPFDAKVAGAHLQVVLEHVQRSMSRLTAGSAVSLHIQGAGREMLARRVGGGYILVLVMVPDTVNDALLFVVDHTVASLQAEAGIEAGTWDPLVDDLRVAIRKARGWAYAPAEIIERETRIPIADVLGRWEESGGAAGGVLYCFRVRTADGFEMTLAHDPAQKRWLKW